MTFRFCCFLLSKLGFSSFRSNSLGRTIYEVVLTFHALFFKCQHKGYFISFLSLCSKCKMLFYGLLQVTQTELERLKSSYRHAVKDATQAKRKYQETSKGGDFWYHLCFWIESVSCWCHGLFFFVCLFSVFLCLVWYVYFYRDLYSVVIFCTMLVYLCVFAEKDRDKAKERYIKASLKLYEVHNEYVLSVQAAQVYHQHHYSQIQPALLSALQTLQQEMVLIL